MLEEFSPLDDNAVYDHMHDHVNVHVDVHVDVDVLVDVIGFFLLLVTARLLRDPACAP